MSGDDPAAAPEPARPSARDLVRRRSRSYARDETGRHHHIGAAPDTQPVLGEDGASRISTSAVQLATLTRAQLAARRAQVVARMERAAAELRFEDAAGLRDDLGRLDAELARREAE